MVCWRITSRVLFILRVQPYAITHTLPFKTSVPEVNKLKMALRRGPDSAKHFNVFLDRLMRSTRKTKMYMSNNILVFRINDRQYVLMSTEILSVAYRYFVIIIGSLVIVYRPKQGLCFQVEDLRLTYIRMSTCFPYQRGKSNASPKPSEEDQRDAGRVNVFHSYVLGGSLLWIIASSIVSKFRANDMIYDWFCIE